MANAQLWYRLFVPSVLLVVLLFLVSRVGSSHFRGGLISCGPQLSGTNGGISSQGNAVIICEFRIAWRLTFNSGTYCNANYVATNRQINGPGSTLYCVSGCSGFVDSLAYTCTEFDSGEDWSQGTRQFTYTVSSSLSQITLRVSTCCWIPLNTGGGTISWGTTVSLTRRSDTGKLNHSPRSAQLPIVRLQNGCNNTIPIHTDDPDGDEVRCRWAVGAECGGVCRAIPGILIQNPCAIHLGTTLANGIYAVALTLEDFPKSNKNAAAFSQVPLQFLVLVTSSSTPCDSKPKLVPPSPDDNKCVAISPGTTYTATIRAEQISSSSSLRLEKFPIVAPIGMQRSTIRMGSNATVKWAEMTVTWTPSVNQYGQNVFCFEASDSTGKNSKQRCLTLLAGASPPKLVPNTIYPNSTSPAAPHLYATLQVDFDQQVFKPTSSAFVHIYEQVGSGSYVEVLSLNTATSKDIKVREHPIHAGRYQLDVFITKRLRVGATYSVTLDRGVVVGAQSCTGGGAPFVGQSDRTIWTFTTNDQVGNYSNCARGFTQLLDYGMAQGDSYLTLGNGTSCQNLSIASSARGFPIWETTHKSISVCENGLVLFDLTSTIRYPQTFPANWSTTPTVFAPYWCLADNSYSRTLSTALRSNVWYHEYSNAIGQVPSQADYQILSAIDALVTAKYHGNSSFQYRSRWALIVTWERITPYPSIYRYQLHNTFQAIFTTDGYRTYSLYAYDADALQWSVPTIRDPRAKYGHAVMGFTVPGHSYSDPRSATVSIARLDNVVDPNNKYLLPQSCDSGALYIYQLYDQNSIEGPRTQCLRWYHQQPPPRNWTTGLPPCPPLLRQAQSDARYRQSSKRLPRLCYLSTVPSAVGAVQECCYHAAEPAYGALLTNYPDGGNAVRYSHLVYDPVIYSAEETLPYSYCCEQEKLCGYFYEKRPSGVSVGYDATQLASAFAGSFTTFDGESYTYDCPGEYSLVNLVQQSPGGRFDFSAQILVDAVVSSTNISVPETSITAIAMSSTHSSTVQVEVNSSVSLRILVDGKDLTNLVTHIYTDEDENVTIACLQFGINCHRVSNGKLVTTPPPYGVYSRTNLSIIVVNRTLCKVVFASGINIEISLSLSTGSLSVTVFLPVHFRTDRSTSTTVTGLCGNFNGNASDEFYFRGDTFSPARYLPNPLTLYDAFFYFCKQWLVPQPNSAVIYPFGRTHSYYATAAANFAFIDLDRSTATVTELFRNTCNGNPSCELLGLTSGSYEAVSEFVDFFNGEESQQVTVGTVYSSQFVTYDGQTYVFNCPGEYILSSVVTKDFRFSAEILVDTLASSSSTVQTTGVFALALSYSQSSTIQMEASASGTIRTLINGIDVSLAISRLLGGAITSLPDCLQLGISCVRGSLDQPFSADLPNGISSSTNVSIIVNNATWCVVVFTSGIRIDITLQPALSTLVLSVSMPRKYQGQTISGLLGNCDGNADNEFLWNGQQLPTPLSLNDAFSRWCQQWVPTTTSVFVYPTGRSRTYYTSVRTSFTFITWSTIPAVDVTRYNSTCGGSFTCVLLAYTINVQISVIFVGYFERRSVTTRSVASCYGSQFTSYDGTRYTYNCPGQYRLTNVASGSYQFRAEVLVDQLPGRYGTSSCTGATAISLQPSDAPLVQVSVGAGSALRVYINRVDISVTVLALLSSATTQQSAFDYSGVRCIRASAITSADQLYAVQSRYPATVVIFSRQRCRLIFRSGISINIAIQTSTGAIAISTGMPVMFRQAAIGGLLGNFDGLRSNDFRLPTGVSVTSTLRGIFTSYGPYWRASSTTSFVYPASKGPTFYSAASLAYTFTDVRQVVVPLQQLYSRSCQSHITCSLLSYIGSSGSSVRDFINTLAEEEKKEAALSTVRPICTGPTRVSISFGAEVTGRVQFTYTQGGQVTFAVIPPVPVGFEFIDAFGRFRWKLQRNAPVAVLQLVVTSSDGVSSVLTPTVFVCDCSHNGTCDFNQITSSLGSSVKTAKCLCPAAYDGEHCESDRDGCTAAFQPCFSGVPCLDRKAPLSGYTCGGCPAGFSGSGHSCFDIDECNSTNLCMQDCLNTQGSYTCSCNSGYYLAADGVSCIDRDECSTKQHNCVQSCTNTVGNYTCSCYTGFNLDADGKSCSAKTRCSTASKCSQLCHIGSTLVEVCSCRNGYTLQSNGATCQDINECALSSNPCQSECNNTDGSFHCTCKTGFVLQSDGTSCQDLDECSTVLFTTCNGGQQCINTLGSFLCRCKTGYTYNTSSSLCTAVSCGQPPQVSNSAIAGSSWVYPSKVQYSCATGYNLVGAVALQCAANGQWSGRPPSCVVRMCPMLNVSSNLQILNNTTNTIYNTVVMFVCNTGYTLNGSVSTRCLADETWTNSVPTCDIVRCPSISQPAYGRAVFTTFTYQSSVNYSCNPGYESNLTTGVSICQASGFWSINNYTCTEVDECQSSPCLNGNCFDFVNRYTCQCNFGFTGRNCETNIDECSSSPCRNQAVCNDGINGYACLCIAGYTGTHCETDVDECLSGPCRNNAACSDMVGSYNCTCSPGYTGNECQVDINECSSVPCMHGASCIDAVNNYWCICVAGYTGILCETNVDECSSNPCRNGTCVDGVNRYNCNCVPGYTGVLCGLEIDECSSSPCQNGATCSDGINHYNCSCVPGYTGVFCEVNINECASSPCLYNSTCVDEVYRFSCMCGSGFFGTLCEHVTNECHPNPCKNLSPCVDHHLDYSCLCSAGWTGKNCSDNIDECSSTPCVNGNCTDLINGYTCNCQPGYTGIHCQTNIDECSSQPCQNGGRCSDGVDGYTCSCVAGFTGAVCETNINECSSNPCQNGATCLDGINHYNCSCVPGYTGVHCETNIDECASTPCQHNSTCVDEVNRFSCVCSGGFYGTLCGKASDECHPNPCKNLSPCVDLHLDYSCLCSAGWTGKNCSDNIDECSSTPCVNGNCTDLINGYTCNCQPGYTGIHCQTNIDECSSQPCQNGGRCSDGVDGYTCSCVAGFTGVVCETNINECSSSPCQNGATCLDGINHYNCSCVPGYTGVHCETNIDECASTPCQHNSTCVDEVNRFSCVCSGGFYGTLCGKASDECHPNPCKNLSPCADLHLDYSCLCSAGWTGKNCSDNIDECSSTPCVNGNCTDLINGYTCNCQPGYTGIHCQTNIDECSSQPCQNGGRCSDGVDGYTCSCVAGFTGVVCETNINECSSSPCQNGATCLDGVNHYNCSCVPGYSGVFCEVNVNECASSPCLNSGTCVDQVNRFYCQCADGFYALFCELRTDECHPNPCENSSPCVDYHLDYSCFCSAGWTGKNCSDNIDECSSTPCVNGNCTDLINGYTCNCQPGYTGIHCQTNIDECSSMPCRNGGRCSDYVNGYSCGCVAGFTGAVCETNIDECSSSPCQNGATCLDGINHYNCSCVPGYTGVHCETNIDECASTPCQHNSTCTDEINRFFCGCSGGFYGTNCEHLIDECHPNPCKNLSPCVDHHLDYSCLCSAGWTGKNCSDNIDECSSTPCVNGNCTDLINGYTCNCQPGYTGIHCQTNIDECSSQPCQNGGRCSDGVDGYTCSCVAGFTGVVCETNINECSSSPCQNGATCLDGINHYNCSCVPGYTGVHCKTNIDECASNPCQHNATCVDEVEKFSCRCTDGFFGTNCEHVTNECHPNPCKNLSPCVDHRLDYSCLCSAGWTGKNCSDNIDECSSTPCVNGNCTDLINGYTCNCQPGYTGIHCQTNIDECSSQPCQNGGRCSDGVDGYTCSCVAGFTGVVCETNINECSSSPCQNGATCLDGINHYNCSCVPGFAGTRCETNILECMSQPCLNNGSCVDGIDHFNCSCMAGYTGVFCGTNIDECLSEPCRNNATCLDRVDGYFCNCGRGYVGVHCELDYNECSSTPCQHNGSCTDHINAFTCQCAVGYTGLACETNIDDCASQPCLHNSTCIDLVAGFSCSCANGYWGDICGNVTDECHPNPCQNNGICLDRHLGHVCNCTPGYVGKNCSTELDECVSNPCGAHGSCMDYINRFECTCDAGYLGRLCNVATDECMSQPCLNNATCSDSHLKYACTCAPGWSGQRCSVNVDECASVPCQNGGKCSDGVNDYTCTCAPGFTGIHCETNIDECLSLPCQHAATCIDKTDGYSCSCAAGYEGLLCENATTECYPNPCYNGAKCIDLHLDYNCVCRPGWTSKNCSADIDECASAPCQNGATCSDFIDGYNCTCRAGFQGSRCQNITNECSPNPCENGASCVDLHRDYLCVCAAGWSGKNCSRDIDECSSGPCINGASCHDLVNQYTCSCASGYTGVHCQTEIIECSSQPCKNNGMCREGVNGYMCACQPGFTGVHCQSDVDECASQPCQYGTCRNDINSYNCSCVVGYTGTNCQAEIDECSSVPCQNGASCADYLVGYNCTCAPGYTGVRCQTELNECLSSPCSNAATCRDAVDGYTCFCLAGYTGSNCETEVDECMSNPCMHNATCSDGVDMFSCACTAGYTGHRCETNVDECTSLPCLHNATCHDGIDAYVCACLPGYSGILCQTDVQECASQPCRNAAQCVDGVNQYTCTCLLGYTGSHCETNVDECAASPCSNGAQCIDGIAGYTCACVAGFTGAHCESSINECLSSPCQHGGRCFDHQAFYTCQCSAGYTGVHCETDVLECASQPCMHGGVCQDEVDRFVCNCSAGYTGMTCETDIDECSPQPCLNSATCLDRINAFSCTCAGGFTGVLCETDIDDCAMLPCQAGGRCVDGVDFYTCACLAGYTGRHCQTDIDDCSQRPCQHNATCRDGVNSFSCLCEAGFSGHLCETNVDECYSSPCQHSGNCTDMVGGYTCQCTPGYLGDQCENARPCPPFSSPSNGKLIGNSFSFGSSLYFSCSPGYALIGNSNLTCLSSGQWNYARPRCANTCPVYPNLPHGIVNGGRTDESRQIGSEIGFACDHGYTLGKDKSAVCLDSARWSIINQSCNPVRCPDLTTPMNGKLVPIRVAYTFPVSAFISCNTGYSSGNVVNASLSCQANGAWDTVPITCTDQNECLRVSSYPCHGEHVACSNTAGSFQCTCLHGYRKENGFCVDYNECEASSTTCNLSTSTCEDLSGRYRCNCKAGYSGSDGVSCYAEGAAGATTTEIGSANAITVSFENTQAEERGAALTEEERWLIIVSLKSTLATELNKYCSKQPGTCQLSSMQGTASTSNMITSTMPQVKMSDTPVTPSVSPAGVSDTLLPTTSGTTAGPFTTDSIVILSSSPLLVTGEPVVSMYATLPKGVEAGLEQMQPILPLSVLLNVSSNAEDELQEQLPPTLRVQSVAPLASAVSSDQDSSTLDTTEIIIIAAVSGVVAVAFAALLILYAKRHWHKQSSDLPHSVGPTEMSNMTDGSEGSEHRAAWNPLYGELNDPASSQLPVWANSYVGNDSVVTKI